MRRFTPSSSGSCPGKTSDARRGCGHPGTSRIPRGATMTNPCGSHVRPVPSRPHPRRRLALALAAACGLAALAAADAPRPNVLFDGKSLEGWKKTDFYKPGDVKVEGGTIVMA